MPSPYRQSDNTPPAPLDELRRRRRKLRVVRWAELLMAGEVGLVVMTGLPRFALPGVVAWFVLGGGLAVATWMLTAPPRGGRVGWPGWLLRGSVPVWLAATGLLQLGVGLQLVSLLSGVLLFVAGAGYALRRPRRARLRFDTMLPALPLLVVALVMGLANFQLPALAPWRWLSLFFLLLAAVTPSAVRHALLPAEQQWWFDDEAETPGAWLALLVDPDGLAEVLRADAPPTRFDSKRKARAWLAKNGYVPAKRALAERLVDSVPPDVLPVPRRRKRRRVAQSAPRVRIATDDVAEPALDEAEADPVDEPALDEAEPPRAVAVHARDK